MRFPLILIIVFFLVMIVGGFLISRRGCGDKSKKFRPVPHWKNGCNSTPRHFVGDSYRDKWQNACALIPDMYKAPVRAPEHQYYDDAQDPVTKIFPVAVPNSVGTTQLTKGISILTFGDMELCKKKILRVSDRETQRGSRVYDIEYGYPHTLKNKSMMRVAWGVDFFDVGKNTLMNVRAAGKGVMLPVDGNGEFLFCVDYSKPTLTLPRDRRDDSLLVRVVETNTNRSLRDLRIPKATTITAANNLLFYSTKNSIHVLDASLTQINHPISAVIKTIPGIDTLSIHSLHVHPFLPMAFIRIGNNFEALNSTDWLWLLRWSDGSQPQASKIKERARMQGFSQDFDWFHFSSNVPIADRLDEEEAHFIIKIGKDFDHGPELSGPIRLWLPIDLPDPSKVRISDFTWVTEPGGLAVIIEDKILRWTFPE